MTAKTEIRKDPTAQKILARVRARMNRLAAKRSRPDLKHAYRQISAVLSGLLVVKG
jgi:hypothetical protein